MGRDDKSLPFFITLNMAKYILRSITNRSGTDTSRPLEEFNDEDFGKYNQDALDEHYRNELESMAQEDQGFEWWVEKVEE